MRRSRNFNKLKMISHALRLSVKMSEATVPAGPVNTSHRTQLLMGTPRTRLIVVLVMCKMSLWLKTDVSFDVLFIFPGSFECADCARSLFSQNCKVC